MDAPKRVRQQQEPLKQQQQRPTHALKISCWAVGGGGKGGRRKGNTAVLILQLESEREQDADTRKANV